LYSKIKIAGKIGENAQDARQPEHPPINLAMSYDKHAAAFNTDISSWNVGQVTIMGCMF